MVAAERKEARVEQSSLSSRDVVGGQRRRAHLRVRRCEGAREASQSSFFKRRAQRDPPLFVPEESSRLQGARRPSCPRLKRRQPPLSSPVHRATTLPYKITGGRPPRLARQSVSAGGVGASSASLSSKAVIGWCCAADSSTPPLLVPQQQQRR